MTLSKPPYPATEPLGSGVDRAIALGGGGEWFTGFCLAYIHTLAENGIDLADADLTVGTSAGSAHRCRYRARDRPGCDGRSQRAGRRLHHLRPRASRRHHAVARPASHHRGRLLHRRTTHRRSPTPWTAVTRAPSTTSMLSGRYATISDRQRSAPSGSGCRAPDHPRLPSMLTSSS